MKQTHFRLTGLLLYTITIGYIITKPYFSYSKGVNILDTIPLVYWILLTTTSIVLVMTIIKTEGHFNIFVGLLYGLLFYITNLYFVIPYEQTDISVANMIEFILSQGRITYKSLAIYPYLAYPMSFILETVIMLVCGIGKISIYTIALLIFMSMLYLGLIYYYYGTEKNIKFAVLSLMIYIIISFWVIDDQVAPQTLALVFIPYLYKLTFNIIKNKQNLGALVLITLLWFAFVFTHPFMFLLYILPIAIVIIYNEFSYNKKNLKPSTIMMLTSIWGLGFILLFYNMLSPHIRTFITSLGAIGIGETWWTISGFLGKHGAFGPVKYTPHPHYELIPKWIADAQAYFLKILLMYMLAVGTCNFIKKIKKKATKKFSSSLIFDIGVVSSGFVLFLVGLVSSFLGQRVFQVIFIPFSRYVREGVSFRRLNTLVIILIFIISPVAFTSFFLTNQTIEAPLYIRDISTLSGGKFVDGHILGNEVYIFIGTDEIYPLTGKKYTIVTWIISGKFSPNKFDLILWNKKIELATEYYGVEDIFRSTTKYRHIVYNNGFTRIYGGNTNWR